MAERIRLGLTGHPLGHSVSPAMHTAALSAAGLEGSYDLFPIPPAPEGLPALNSLLEAVRAGQILGLNVTIPHKQAVLPLLDALTPEARRAGAVNTIYRESGRLIGHNTDTGGFRADLAAALGLPPGRALILGAGGAAAAVVTALVDDGWQVWLAARRAAQAQALNDSTGAGRLRILPLPFSREAVRAAAPELVVNATPAGTAPEVHASPWPESVPFPHGAAVYDLVYNPRETALLKAAAAEGLRTAGGLGMLVAQAALAFEVWTHQTADRARMLAAADQALP